MSRVHSTTKPCNFGPWRSGAVVGTYLHSSVGASWAQRGAQGMGDTFPVLPYPTSECQVLLCGQPGRAALLDRSHTMISWLCQQQQLLELLCRAKVLVPSASTDMQAAVLWYRALHSPGSLPGLFQGKTGQERPCNPPKETPAHSSRQAVT